eukprot:SAG31_NODE_2233_length_6136_cov_2.169455_5_plen_569_part_00
MDEHCELALGDMPALSRAAVAQGKALLDPLLTQIMAGGPNCIPDQNEFRACYQLFMSARYLDPDNAEAQEEAEKLRELLQMVSGQGDKGDHGHSHGHGHDASKPGGRTTVVTIEEDQEHDHTLDVLIVGAGASGVGVALMLIHTFGLDPKRVVLVERGEGVGETFRRWPAEMRFISPSFNQQGWTASFDLNSVAYGTSPAFTLHAEHPTGEQYATYLSALAEAGKLCVRTRTEVKAVRPCADGVGFEVDVASQDQFAGPAGGPLLRSRYVIWAAGEFQYPRARSPLFPGAQHCLHNSDVRSWKDVPGDDFVVIGGYESGMDAASNLASNGKRCTVVSSTAFWNVTTADPSSELAPYTAERLRAACASPTPPSLLAPLRVFAVEPPSSQGGGGGDGYLVRARWGPPVEHSGGQHRVPLPAIDTVGAEASLPSHTLERTEGAEISIRTPQPPLLCAGFEGSIALGVVKELFAWGKGVEEDGGGCAEGSPLLNEYDESTTTPGLFLVGPSVRHGELSFCFVYKFRQRFGVVADAIARGLGHDTAEPVEACRKMNMFLDDFTCCKAGCGETC